MVILLISNQPLPIVFILSNVLVIIIIARSFLPPSLLLPYPLPSFFSFPLFLFLSFLLSSLSLSSSLLSPPLSLPYIYTLSFFLPLPPPPLPSLLPSPSPPLTLLHN